MSSVFYAGEKKKLCGVFQPTALDFSHVLTNEDGVLLLKSVRNASVGAPVVA